MIGGLVKYNKVFLFERKVRAIIRSPFQSFEKCCEEDTVHQFKDIIW